MDGKGMLSYLQNVQEQHKDEGLEEIIISSYWDIEDVDDVLADTPMEGKLTRAQKLHILRRSIERSGDLGDDQIRDTICEEAHLILGE